MPTNILMPALSPTMEDGTLAKWLVAEGDHVKSGDLLAEIETDKATMEFEAVDEGIIGKLLVAAGTEGVKVNAPIAVLLAEDEDQDAETPVSTEPAAPAQKSKPEPQEQPAAPATQSAPAPKSDPDSRIFASPLARRIAGEKGLDLSQITGTGPRGRIVKSDVMQAKPTSASPTQQVATAAVAPSVLSHSTIAKVYQDRPHDEIQLDGMRKTIAARLTEAKQTIPHFYLRRDIRLDNLLELRAKINQQLEARNIKLSLNDYIIKACAMALQQFPDANAVWAGDRILRLKPSDIAVAVAIPGGLFTPVLKDADTKSLTTLSAEMKDLATRARDKKLAPHEYQGGSFAISNLGMYGIDNFDAVINPPHGAILAVGAGVLKPVVGKGKAIEVATVMSVTLSVDHRVIDGALGAELLAAIVSNLENPLAMLA